MKLGYAAFAMAVDVYIIREYEKEGEMYIYRDLIKIADNGHKITSIQIAENPRTERMHEEWAKFHMDMTGLEDIMREAITSIMEDESGTLVRFYNRIDN